MNWFSIFLFLSYLSIATIIIQQSSVIGTDIQKKFSLSNLSTWLFKFPFISGTIQGNREDFRCPKNWSQFNDSCYLLSTYISTPNKANQICHAFHLNDSRLMQIRHPIQLLYAGYVMTKNNLNKLMLEIDQDLMQDAKIANMLSSMDDIQWKEIVKDMFKDGFKINKETTQSSQQLPHKENSYNDNTMNNDEKDQNKFESIDRIRTTCNQIKWKVINKDSNILLLTMEMDSDERICSLSNVDFSEAYSHLCQYILDRCLNNIMCGENGVCNNTETGFNCSCSFFYESTYCDKLSSEHIQLILTIPIIVICSLFVISTTRNWILHAIKRQNKLAFILLSLCHYHSTNYFNVQRTTSSSSSSINNNRHASDIEQYEQEQHNLLSTEIEHPSDENSDNINPVPQEHSNRSRRWVFGLTFVLFLILFIVRFVQSSTMNDKDSCENNVFFIYISQMFGQCRCNIIENIFNGIRFIISLALIIYFSYLQKQEKIDLADTNPGFGMVAPFKIFQITDRWKVTVINIIALFEILDMLDESFFNSDETLKLGILTKMFKRFVFIAVIGFRYYPILASLQFQNIKVRFWACIYIIISISFLIFSQSSCNYWLLFSKKCSLIDSNGLLSTYNCIRNGVYYLLISYISVELFLRLFYDSIYIKIKEKKSIWDIEYKEVDKYTFSDEYWKNRFRKKTNENEENNVNKNEKLNKQGYLSKFINYIKKIYVREDDFRYTTLIISTYTITFILLLHLTFKFISLYTTEKTDYVIYLRAMLERVLNIQIGKQSYQWKVILSAIITMIIHFIQLFCSIRYYRKSMNDMYNDLCQNIQSSSAPRPHEIVPKSVKYPAYVFGHFFGSFVICFYFILFIFSMFMEILFRLTSFKWSLIYIFTALFAYILHKLIIELINIYFTRQYSNDENNLRVNRPYSILMYFNLISSAYIGIMSSIDRLIISIIENIIFLSRIDYTLLVKPLESFDKANVIFRNFIRLETLYTHGIIYKCSRTVEMVSPSPGTQETNRTDELRSSQDNQIPPQQLTNTPEHSVNATETSQNTNDIEFNDSYCLSDGLTPHNA